MRVCGVLTLFIVLCEGSSSKDVYTVTEGGDFSAECWFQISGSKKVFCKNECTKKDILVQTSGNREQSGRHSISFDEQSKIMTVGIRNVTLSDAGRYHCVLMRTLFPEGSKKFTIKVTKAAPPAPAKPTAPPVIPTSTVPNSPSPPDTSLSLHLSTLATSATTGAPLYVSLAVVLIVVLSSFSLVTWYCFKKVPRAEEAPVNSEYVGVPQIVEDGTYQSLSLDTVDPNHVYSTIGVQQGAL